MLGQDCDRCIDSLRNIIKTGERDTNTLHAFTNNRWLYYDGDTAKVLLDEALNLARNLNDQKWEGIIQMKRGYWYSHSTEFEKAMDDYLKALTIFEETNNKKYTGKTKQLMGVMLTKQGLMVEARENFIAAKSLFTEVGDSINIANSLGNIANTYPDSMYEKSNTLLEEAIKIYDQSPSDFNQRRKAIALGNIASNLISYRVNLDRAQSAIKEANSTWERVGSYAGIAYNDVRLGNMYLYLQKYDSAEFYLTRCYDYGVERNWATIIDISYGFLAEAHYHQGNYRKAYDVLKYGSHLHDSVFSSSNSEKLLEMTEKYDKEKERRERELKEQLEQLIQKEKDIKSRNTKIYLVAGILILVLFALFFYKRFKETKKQNKIIEEQKGLVEEAHQEIKDSIAYAKRIQSAILPPTKIVKEYLKDSFILYKPKDIVAGDFYWMENTGDKVLFAAADCTGHGVPGAMVSVVCNNALNRSVREHGLTTPGKILDKSREIVIQEFEKSEQEVKDGMDIALCTLEGNMLQYAGAHNPLWIIRKGEIIETKANKQPIGKFDNPEPYTTHSFDLFPGDSLYIFSDGYVDQFGGEKGKKFKARAFRELLLSIQDKSMEDQKLIINQTFEEWRGSLEQIDDVCVIGVRI